jgi:hypothetical protein
MPKEHGQEYGKGREEEEYAYNPERENRSPAERRLRKCMRKVASELEG